MEYVINEILHSGRKGIRNEPVNDFKYDGLVDSIVELKGLNVIEDCKQFDRLTILPISSDSADDFWETSAVIGISKSFHGEYYVETINTIYVLEEYDNGG